MTGLDIKSKIGVIIKVEYQIKVSVKKNLLVVTSYLKWCFRYSWGYISMNKPDKLKLGGNIISLDKSQFFVLVTA